MFGMLPIRMYHSVKFGIFELICVSPLLKVPMFYEQALPQILGKVAEIIELAEKYGGKSLKAMPIPNCPKDSIIICTSIQFRTETDIQSFEEQLPNILKQ